jgi:hypothetical protein
MITYRRVRHAPMLTDSRSLILSESLYGLSEYIERRFQLGYAENGVTAGRTDCHRRVR